MFKHYEIRQVVEFRVTGLDYPLISPLIDVDVHALDTTVIKTFWSLYGFTAEDLTEIICDRDTFEDVADMYAKITGTKLTEPRDYFCLPTGSRYA